LESAEEIRQLVSELTKSTFKLTSSDRYPVPSENVKWFMWCPEITEMREIPYLNVVWADKDDNIYLDSMPIGNTTNWVARDYGEKAAQDAMDLDFSDYPIAISKLEHSFPLVGSRISTLEEIVKEISAKTGLSIEVFHYGRKGRATLRLRGRVSAGDSSGSSSSLDRMNKIRQSVDALKEAWERVRD